MWSRSSRTAADASPPTPQLIVFDQPIKPKAAAKLIHLWTNNVADHEEKPGQGTEIPINLSNPSSGRLQGYTLNPKQIIEVKAQKPTEPRQERLAARRGRPARRVRARLQLRGRRSPGAQGGQLRLLVRAQRVQWEGAEHTNSNEIVLECANQLANGDSQLKADIRISPALNNVNVWGGGSWDSNGRISISAAFEPSTRYAVSIPELKDRYGNTIPALEARGRHRADARKHLSIPRAC